VRRPALFLAVAAIFGALMPLGCLQNFDAFEPTASSGAGGMPTTSSTGGATGTGGMPTTSSTGGAGGTGGMPTTTTTTGMPTENCTNGVDDDGDGDADCADADCTMGGYVCLDKLPNGWAGPYALFEGATGMVPASCPSEFPTSFATGNSELNAPAATCKACSCTPPAVTCTAGNISSYNQNNCPNNGTSVAQDGTCQTVSGSPNSFKAAAPTAMAMGMCTSAGGGVNTTPMPTWGKEDRVCGDAPLGVGCSGTAVCAPPAPTGASFCIARQGEQTCPGTYPQKHVIYKDVVDTRDCTACSCSNGTVSCTASTALYASADCTGTALDTLVNDGTVCSMTTGAMSFKVTTMAGNATCQTAGGMPTGDAVGDPASAITVCCN